MIEEIVLYIGNQISGHWWWLGPLEVSCLGIAVVMTIYDTLRCAIDDAYDDLARRVF